MKRTHVLILVTIGILVIDCENDSSNKDDIPIGWQQVSILNVAFDDCGCSNIFIKEYSDYKSTLFANVDSIFMKQDVINAISFDTVSKTCILIKKNGNMIGTARICNCPEEISNWELKGAKGIEVIISGTEYESCNGIIGPSIFTYSDIVLSKFLKKINP